MAYRVLMELQPRPDSIEEWIWNEPSSTKASSTGGKAWTGKLTSGGTVWEYSTQSAANTKMNALDSADSTNRRYKVVEI
jgi:hypothetical protein